MMYQSGKNMIEKDNLLEAIHCLMDILVDESMVQLHGPFHPRLIQVGTVDIWRGSLEVSTDRYVLRVGSCYLSGVRTECPAYLKNAHDLISLSFLIISLSVKFSVLI